MRNSLWPGSPGEHIDETGEYFSRGEIGIDAELENSGSIAAHKVVGFEEVERVVCFITKLG